jgi:hypothetical protein
MTAAGYYLAWRFTAAAHDAFALLGTDIDHSPLPGTALAPHSVACQLSRNGDRGANG